MSKEAQELIDKKPKILDEVSLFDQLSSVFTQAWDTRYRRVKTVTLIDNITFDDTLSSKESAQFYCEPYSKFSLFIDLVVTSTPTDILVEVKFSDNRVKFYKLMNGPFGDLRYEDSAGNLLEEIQGECRASWCQVKATATGTTAANKFTLTAKMVFNT